ncbi:hypothetical protein UP12_19500 (plasmid) [Bacillus pumilus]|uniref:hypothetical protein n=1 Tax=Bacillus pumilus TaxID=1408 RepID=UPI0007766537|nr:hypothetical protein [Bacillus pumilus]AMM99592.1 hypothetical protein UP12_19500 [Bacillus pumilus]
MGYTCPYCGSGLHDEKDHYFCDFCVMDISKDQAQMGGHRIHETHQKVDPSDLKKTTPELMAYSTWTLILLLKEARKLRASFYKDLSIARSKSRGSRDKARADDVAAEYQEITKRMYIIENILKKRLSYVPANLNDSYLRDYEKRMSTKKTNDKMITFSDSDGEV